MLLLAQSVAEEFHLDQLVAQVGLSKFHWNLVYQRLALA